VGVEHHELCVVSEPGQSLALDKRHEGIAVEGESNKIIAAHLDCAERTVEVHVTHLLDKLDADSRAGLGARVWQ
jgi:DNA-binding NarL/FixJ family response regulator